MHPDDGCAEFELLGRVVDSQCRPYSLSPFLQVAAKDCFSADVDHAATAKAQQVDDVNGSKVRKAAPGYRPPTTSNSLRSA